MSARPVRAVVVGSGIAGITAALHADDAGAEVTLVTKGELDHANTRYAQGGIAGVMFADDRTADHLADTLTAGAGLADPAAVRVLVEEGPARIRELIDAGVGFDRDADGVLRKGLEAAHSYPRILHAGGDATGAAIEHALVSRLRESRVRVIEHAFLLRIMVENGRAAGIELLVDAGPGRSRRVLEADAVVLATGGAGQLYAHTTNPLVATGDGIAAAMRAGADVSDLEFVQFHPTVLPQIDGHEPFLISEAVRGEGAVLLDEDGHRFALDAHPDGELAPRDVVARAIALAMERSQGRPVRLDATALGAPDTAGFLARRFPTIDRAVRERGLDWAREPIPVTPAAHYLMGGVTTDLDGRTTLPGLYAVGEVARTGVHGANRLASNSLLEGAVFGARVGTAVVADAGRRAEPWRGPWPRATVCATRPHGVSAHDAPAFTRAALQELLWENAGLVRDAAGLGRAASTLTAWAQTPRRADTVTAHEDENLLLVAQSLVAAALHRTQSVGAHFRRDASVPDTEQELVAQGASC